MSAIQNSSKSLPEKPSQEYLRKEAKRLARDEGIQLAAAQRRLAHDYGYRNWAELMTAIENLASATGAKAGDSSGSPPPGESAANVLPLLPLRGLIAFPHVSYPIFFGRPASINAVQYAKERKLPILLAAQRDLRVAAPSASDLYEVGTVGAVVDAERLPDGTIKSVVEGKRRARVSRFIFGQDFSRAEAVVIEETGASDAQLEKLIGSVVSAFVRRRLKIFEDVGPAELFATSVTTADNAAVLADRIASELPMELAWKQALLELLDPAERLEKLLAYLNASRS
jgi:ATP-dependent Lon protease